MHLGEKLSTLERVELSPLIMNRGAEGEGDEVPVREAQVAVEAAVAGVASIEAWEVRVSGTMVVSGRLGRLDTLGGRAWGGPAFGAVMVRRERGGLGVKGLGSYGWGGAGWVSRRKGPEGKTGYRGGWTGRV